MYEQAQWGTVNLGVDVLQGHGEQSQPGVRDYNKLHPHDKNKQQYNPGRNQELKLPADIFPMHHGERTNPNSSTGKVMPSSVHERIKEMIGEGMPRREAVARAHKEARDGGRGDVGTITKAQVYAKKYQAIQPEKQPSVFSTQVQNYPFM